MYNGYTCILMPVHYTNTLCTYIFTLSVSLYITTKQRTRWKHTVGTGLITWKLIAQSVRRGSNAPGRANRTLGVEKTLIAIERPTRMTSFLVPAMNSLITRFPAHIDSQRNWIERRKPIGEKRGWHRMSSWDELSRWAGDVRMRNWCDRFIKCFCNHKCWIMKKMLTRNSDSSANSLTRIGRVRL